MLESRNLHKVYNHGKKDIRVLKGIDLKVSAGSFVVVAGPSGAGKSTLLNILGGIDSPSEGKVFFEGEDIYSLSDVALSRMRNERIGFVFQFYHLLPEFTVLENVLMPAWINLGYKKAMLEDASGGGSLRKKASGLLVMAGLEARLGHFPSQLSGGEQQRVAIVRALMNNPRLLLCDEPTGNLDSVSGEAVISLIKKINRQENMTVVMVTHNLELARIADTVYYLKDGLLRNNQGG
ncbi:MAG: ABC transporter ATP-binding protein [Candidatus Omnitrophota bacterium]